MDRLACALALVVIGGCSSPPADDGASASCRAAKVVEARKVDDRTVDLDIDSPAMGGVVSARVLLPAAWADTPGRTWPVLYLLHGSEVLADRSVPPQNYKAWTTNTDVATLSAGSDVIVVMPEGGNVGWYSDWYNGGAGGPPAWETFHLCELRTILERDYRASDVRAIAGLSMGGMGATSYAARNPGMFRAVASFSGALHTEQMWDGIEVSVTIQGFERTALWGSGDPTDPDSHLDIWRAHDPYELAGKLVDIPVFVSAGNGDPGPLDAAGAKQDAIEPGILIAGQAFSQRLQDLGGSVTTDFYGAGTHHWPYWEQELHRAFPMLMQAIGAQ